MTLTATEFKAKCLSLMDQVAQTHEPILITKHGEVVAQLTAAPAAGVKPWLVLRGTVTVKGDIARPALSDREVAASLKRKAKRISGRSA